MTSLRKRAGRSRPSAPDDKAPRDPKRRLHHVAKARRPMAVWRYDASQIVRPAHVRAQG